MAEVDIPAKVAAQIQDAVDLYRKPLRDARARNATEGDTGLLVSRMLTDVFGYDPFTEVTSEFKIKGQYVDFAVRDGDRIGLVIEVKAIGINLNHQHLFQATSYAMHEGVEWVVLTNAAQWDLYRVTFTQPVDWHRVTSMNFVDGRPDPDELAMLHKWGMKKGLAELAWTKMSALSPANLVKALLADDTMKPIAAYIRKTTGMRVEIGELRERLVADILRPGLVGEVGVTDIPRSTNSAAATTVRRVRLKSLLDGNLVTAGAALSAEYEGVAVRAMFEGDGTISLDGSRFRNLYDLSQAAFGRSFGYECWDMWALADGVTIAALRDRYIAGVSDSPA